MTSIPATKAKKNFGELLTQAIKEPVFIEKHQKKMAVMLSIDTYEELIHSAGMEDKLLATLAEKAKQEGYLSASQSKALLDEIAKC